MNPWITSGDKVRFLPKKQYSVGDIVVCCYNNRFFVHRIVCVHHGMIITKGDNTDILDAKITSTNVMGVIVARKNSFDREYLIPNTNSIFIKVGALFSFVSGKAMSKYLRTNFPVWRKALLYIHNITKKISKRLYIFCYKKY